MVGKPEQPISIIPEKNLKNIMHIIQIIDLLKFGGAQKLLITFAAECRVRQIDLTIISVSHKNEPRIIDELKALGAQVHSIPTLGILFDLKRFWQLVKLLRREPADIIHTHLTISNVIGTLAGKIVGVPTVASLHNVSIEKPPKGWIPIQIRFWLEAYLLRYMAQEIIAVGYIVADTHQERFSGKPITVIPNAVDSASPLGADERTKLRSEVADDPNRPLLISVGRLVTQKGYSDMLTAMASLRQTHPSAMLAIAGNGSKWAELTAKINELDLNDNVRLLGFRDDVPHLLAASDIFVSSSLWEGLPVAVLEAMAAGLPIVATSVGDVPKVVVKDTGLVIPPKKPDMLAAAVGSLLDDPERIECLGAAAKAHVNRHYSAQAWVDRLLEVYNEAMMP